MGRSEKRELVNRLTVLLLHLLKWQFQPALHGNSWRLTHREQRYRLEDHLDDNPSLKSQLGPGDAQMPIGCALIEAQRETGLARSTFPTDCPYTFDQAMSPDFWPE